MVSFERKPFFGFNHIAVLLCIPTPVPQLFLAHLKHTKYLHVVT